MAQNLPDPAPYAGGPPSLNKFQAGQGPADTRHNAGKELPLDSPMGNLAPYAGTSNTCATDESGQGSFEGDASTAECSYDVHDIDPYAGN
jgi:hypothetical protein